MTSGRWTLRTVTEAFLGLEHELDLLRGPVARTWESARFPVHQRLLTALGATGQGQVHYPSLQPSLVRRAAAYARSALARPSLGSGPADFLFAGHPRRQRTSDGRWTDPYVDPLLASLGASAAVIEAPFMGGHRAPPLVPGVRYLDDVILLGGVAGLLTSRRAAPREEREMRQVADEIRSRFGVDAGAFALMDEARRFRAGSLRLLDQLVAQVQPRALVVVVSYGHETLIEVARQRGVPVAELQHGVIYPYHLGYTFPEAPKSTFPDHLLSFGRFWADATRYPISAERIHATGFPAFDAAREGFARRPGSSILFVSQLAVGEPLSRMAAELARESGEPVVYKLHPGEALGWAERYPWLRESGARVVDDPGVTVYDLFATARAQVGVFSTALYEGLGLGVPTVVAKLPGWEACEPLLRLGYAQAAEDASGLVAAIGRATPPSDTGAFFEPGGLERAAACLHEIARG